MHYFNFFQPDYKACQKTIPALLVLSIFAITHHNVHAEDSVVIEENIFSSSEADDNGLNNFMGIENEEEGQIELDMRLDLIIDNDL